jgi:pyrroloquinoline quinone (PQQ) biosynthesis protein C
MTTKAGNKEFVDSVINDIIQPGIVQLMDSRYFTDLREGKLTTRRMQGFAIQHYIHNMGILKAFALGAAQNAANDRTFMAYANGMGEELTHPNMCKTFGYSVGLTEADFDSAVPTFGCLSHTAVCIHGMYLANVVEMRGNALSNETMVQRYATEFDTYLRQPPYNMSDDALEFFIIHKGADIEHTERAANAIAELATTDEDAEKVRTICRNMARLKLGKFDSIYDDYV